jgi:hypothetical protein
MAFVDHGGGGGGGPAEGAGSAPERLVPGAASHDYDEDNPHNWGLPDLRQTDAEKHDTIDFFTIAGRAKRKLFRYLKRNFSPPMAAHQDDAELVVITSRMAFARLQCLHFRAEWERAMANGNNPHLQILTLLLQRLEATDVLLARSIDGGFWAGKTGAEMLVEVERAWDSLLNMQEGRSHRRVYTANQVVKIFIQSSNAAGYYSRRIEDIMLRPGSVHNKIMIKSEDLAAHGYRIAQHMIELTPPEEQRHALPAAGLNPPAPRLPAKRKRRVCRLDADGRRNRRRNHASVV